MRITGTQGGMAWRPFLVLAAMVLAAVAIRLFRWGGQAGEAALAVSYIPLGAVLALPSYVSPPHTSWVRVLRRYLMASVAFAGLYYSVYYVAPTGFSFAACIASKADVSRKAELMCTSY